MGGNPSPGLREDPLPWLTIDVSTHQGLFHLGWSKGEANQEQDVLEAPRIHLTGTIEDIKIASEGCRGRQLLSGMAHVVFVWCAGYVHACGGQQVASCLYCLF